MGIMKKLDRPWRRKGHLHVFNDHQKNNIRNKKK